MPTWTAACLAHDVDAAADGAGGDLVTLNATDASNQVTIRAAVGARHIAVYGSLAVSGITFTGGQVGPLGASTTLFIPQMLGARPRQQ